MIRYKAFAVTETGVNIYIGILTAKDDYQAIEKAERMYAAITPLQYASIAAIWEWDDRFFSAKSIDDIATN